MALGRYKIPGQLRDEDKYWIFTKSEWLWILAGAGTGFLLYSLFQALRLTVIGVILGALCLAAGVALAKLEVPQQDYLRGGGQKVSEILLRRIGKRKKGGKTLYIKNYDREADR